MQHQTHQEKKSIREVFRKKLTIAVGLFLVVYMLYLKWSIILQKSPFVNSIYSFMYTNLAGKTFLGIMMMSFFGGLFFIFLPIEAIFVYYFESGRNMFLVTIAVIIGSLVALYVDYLFGFIFGEKIARKMLKKKFETFAGYLNRFGGFLIIAGNAIFIFPIELASVAIGSLKYNQKKFIIYTLIGKIIKFAIIGFILYYYGTDFDFGFF